MQVKRNTLNFWIDILTFLVFLLKIWTGLLIHYVLPAGQGRGKSLLLWGLNRHDYGVIHFYLAALVMGVFDSWPPNQFSKIKTRKIFLIWDRSFVYIIYNYHIQFMLGQVASSKYRK